MLRGNEGVQGGAELPPAGDVVVNTFDLVSLQLYETYSHADFAVNVRGVCPCPRVLRSKCESVPRRARI